MRLDQFNNPVFNEQDIFETLYKGIPIHGDMFVDSTPEVESLASVSGLTFWLPLDNYSIPVPEYDAAMQSSWFMPDNYKNMDIEAFIASKCPKENYQRIVEELDAFKERNMLDLLRWLKYFVDTCEKEGIVWGVGRGSSVASYILYLIGVHNIDSLKYKLDWREFLR